MGASAGEVVLLGIDAGGSSIRARAVLAGAVVHDGRGGPGNPLAVDRGELARNYERAVRGCPEPGFVSACVAGAGARAGQVVVEDVLRARLPRAVVSVVPDYVAAYMAARDADVVVIAGTGSIVCSRDDPGGEFRISGGRGWRAGDPGSGASLGRAVLARLWTSPAPELAAAVRDVLGATDRSEIEGALERSRTPAADLARAAPLLLASAAAREGWARAALDEEMGALAASLHDHVERWVGQQQRQTAVALVGGVWASRCAVAAFERQVVVRLPEARVALCAAAPVDGAVRLAAELARASGVSLSFRKSRHARSS